MDEVLTALSPEPEYVNAPWGVSAFFYVMGLLSGKTRDAAAIKLMRIPELNQPYAPPR